MTHPLILEGLIPHMSGPLQKRVPDREWGRADTWGIQGKRRERSPEGYGHCSNCDIELVLQTAGLSAVRRGSGRCRTCERDYQQDYYRQNPNIYAAAAARRRSHIHKAAGYSSVAQRKARAEVYGGLCYLCGRLGKGMDHVIPLAKGGTNWPANLRPICTSCNSIKGAKWPYDIEAHRAQANFTYNFCQFRETRAPNPLTTVCKPAIIPMEVKDELWGAIEDNANCPGLDAGRVGRSGYDLGHICQPYRDR